MFLQRRASRPFSTAIPWSSRCAATAYLPDHTECSPVPLCGDFDALTLSTSWSKAWTPSGIRLLQKSGIFSLNLPLTCRLSIASVLPWGGARSSMEGVMTRTQMHSRLKIRVFRSHLGEVDP
jgi:hypothetical protein